MIILRIKAIFSIIYKYKLHTSACNGFKKLMFFSKTNLCKRRAFRNKIFHKRQCNAKCVRYTKFYARDGPKEFHRGRYQNWTVNVAPPTFGEILYFIVIGINPCTKSPSKLSHLTSKNYKNWTSPSFKSARYQIYEPQCL